MREGNGATVAVVDYGLGNLFSVKNACENAGLHGLVTSSAEEILCADAVILPGVGAFGDAMAALRRRELVRPLHEFAAQGRPMMGICLGMQLMMTESREFGLHRGLGFFAGEVVPFQRLHDISGRVLKVPQVGWNHIAPTPEACEAIVNEQHAERAWDSSLLEGQPSGSYMYFVHSFYAVPEDNSVALSYTRYGDTTFCSSLSRGNLFAAQFHPERSGRQGMAIYHRFAALIKSTAYPAVVSGRRAESPSASIDHQKEYG